MRVLFIESAQLAERRLLRAIAARRPAWLTLFFRAWTRLGDPSVAIATVAGLLAWDLLATGTGAGLHAALALTVAHVLSQALKRMIRRPRPRLPVGLRALIDPPDRFSFPSGHASAALSLGLPIAAVVPAAAGALVVLAAVLVGASRCYLGVHYAGDVMAGWLIALGAVLATAPIAAAILGP